MSEDPGTSTSENADPGVPEQDDGSVGTLELFFDPPISACAYCTWPSSFASATATSSFELRWQS